jgi:hypothetical protein
LSSRHHAGAAAFSPASVPTTVTPACVPLQAPTRNLHVYLFTLQLKTVVGVGNRMQLPLRAFGPRSACDEPDSFLSAL